MPASHHAWISATACWLVSLKFSWNASNVYRMLQQDCWLGPESTTILLLCYKNFTGCQWCTGSSTRSYSWHYKALQGLASLYLQELLSYRTARPGLRSAGTLNVPRRRQRFGYRSFACAAPHLWNSLPRRLRNTNDLDSFKTNLKTHLFQLAFPS